MTGGMRGGALILGNIGREREDGGAATAAGSERDIVPTPGKTTGEIYSDTAVVTGCEGDCTSIPGKTTGEIDSDTAVVAGCKGDRTSIPGETTGE